MNLSKTPVIKIENLTKKFGRIVIADKINLELHGGKVYALIGPNGAGKTTLLNILNGFLKPDEGAIYINGVNITNMEPYSIAKDLKVGRLFQDLHIFKKMTVYENIVCAKRYKGEENPIVSFFTYPRFLKEEKTNIGKVEHLLKELKVPVNKKSVLAENLSFGQQKLVVLARLLMGDFDILLLDEPVAGVQPEVKKIIYQIIENLKQKNKLIIVVEHEMEAVKKVADEVIFIGEGKVRIDKAEKILSDPKIIKEYIGITQWKVRKKKSEKESKEIILRAENLYASYQKLEILKGVNIELRKGEIVALIGPNGAGKSTLLKVLAGVLKIKSGKIWMKINGKMEDITDKDTRYRVFNGIGYFVQGGEIFPNLTVKENLELCLMNLPKKIINEKIEEVCSFIPDLKRVMFQKAGLLSGGERHLVALGMTIIRSPKVLLYLDEPSAGLSPVFTKKILEIIRRLKDNLRACILLVEQKIGDVLKIADRVYIMKHGKIEKKFLPWEITEEEIKKIYIGN